MLRVTFADGVFQARCSFSERELVRKAGFRWSGERKLWYSETSKVAVRLREFCDPSALKEINRVMIVNSPWSGPLPYPKGLRPYPFQLGAVRYVLERNKSYLGLDPGLGKTPISVIVSNALQAPTVFVAPAFLTRNVEAEFQKWATWSPKILRLEPRGKEPPIQYATRMIDQEAEILIVPDSVLHRPETILIIKDLNHWAEISGRGAVLMVDEAHRYKNFKAQRTAILFGGKDENGDALPPMTRRFERQVYLSGTPIPNGRPMELFPILSTVAPETIDFMSGFEYGRKFCRGHRTRFGWDFSGASNMPELRRRVIGPFMLRLKTEDVLKDLPPMTEELVLIGDAPAKLIKLEKELLQEHSPSDLVKHQVASTHIATYRRELGKLKVKPAVDFIRSLLDDGEESLLVFAFHKEVIADLKVKLGKYRPLVITGSTSNAERHAIVTKFQDEKKGHRLFIGNYQAAGVGLTLTKATRVIFVEYSYVPSENDQAAKRAHRIGQRFHVLVQFLVYTNSLDKKVLESNLRKREIIAHI